MATTNQPAHQKRERLELLLESIQIGCWEWNLAKDRIWASDPFYILLGYQPGEIKLTYSFFIDHLLASQDIPIVKQGIQEWVFNSILTPTDVTTKDKTILAASTPSKTSSDEPAPNLLDDQSSQSMESALDSFYLNTSFPNTSYQKDPSLNDFYQTQLRLRTKSGQYIWVEAYVKRILIKGKPVRLTGWIKNSNLRKKYEQQTSRISFLLEQTSKLAKMGGWEYTLESQWPIWTKETYAIHQLDPSVQISIEQAFEFYAPAAQPLIRHHFEKALTEAIPYDLELEFITAKGNLIWVRTIGVPLMDPSGQVLGIQGLIQDIDDRKKKELALQESLQVNEEQNKRLLGFAYIVSHNLRSYSNNLAALMNLYEGEADVAQKETLLAKISVVVGHLGQTVEHLTETVHIQTGPQPQALVGFEDLFHAVQELLKVQIDTQRAELFCDFTGCQQISYVAAYLDSIFLNLTTNALKYAHPDRSPQIRFRTFVEKGKPVLTVEDNGVGIDLELYGDKVFGMYKTFHNHPDGRGMGLFLTKTQIESQGGQISVESQVEKGSIFKIVF